MHRPSRRRMAVAQKRDEEYRNVLRRQRTRTKQQKWFWHWFHSTDNKIFLYSHDPARPYQEIGLLGLLPDCRPLIVRIAWVVDHWLVVSDAPYHAYAVGATISKAITLYRSTMNAFMTVHRRKRA